MTHSRGDKKRDDATHDGETAPVPMAGFGRALSRSRFIVIVAVVAVMLIAVSLFLLGSLQAVYGLRDAWGSAFRGEVGKSDFAVQSLEVVATMLKAVVFYIVGVGLYSLFIAPLNITVALGIESLNDLESKLLSIVVVILATTFLEHFIRWEKPLETLQFGGALALVVAALVLFQSHSHRAHEDQMRHDPNLQVRAQREMFHTDHEHHEIKPDEVSGPKSRDAGGVDSGPRKGQDEA